MCGGNGNAHDDDYDGDDHDHDDCDVMVVVVVVVMVIFTFLNGYPKYYYSRKKLPKQYDFALYTLALRTNPSVILSEVRDINLLHLVVVYLHVRELYLSKVVIW